ncbi:MAG TPA: ABC transporter ATP-binding protein [Opitutaceae bacterium]|nr:ABC transporter ATP-binding protein [Opitutaceae bacterium]
MAILELSGVSKSFGRGERRTCVLREIDLAIAEGEFLAIVGFSGSGKTTLINLIAGLARPDGGSIRLDGREVDGPGPDRGLVFQNYSLLPWLTVEENIALAVDNVFPGWPRERRRELIGRHLDLVHLGPARHKLPRQLSGGMRQRVAVARALAMNPRILLLDEPLGALDALTRGALQDEIERIWEAERKTVVLITNDVDEALLLADRVIPLSPGPEARLGPPVPVALPRPRDRRELNHDPEFKRLRAAITGWLLDAGAVRKVAVGPRPLPRLLTAA